MARAGRAQLRQIRWTAHKVPDNWRGTQGCTAVVGYNGLRQFSAGKFYSYPLKAFEALANLGPDHERDLHALYAKAFSNYLRAAVLRLGPEAVGERLFPDILLDINREGVGYALR